MQSLSPLPVKNLPAIVTGSASAQSQAAEPSVLVEYGRLLFRRKWTVLLFAVLGGLAGWLSTIAKPPLYQARTSLDIQGMNENFMNSRNVEIKGPPGPYSAEFYLQTQIKLLQSESTIERARRKLASAPQSGEPAPEDLLSQWRRRTGLFVPPPINRDKLLAEAARDVKVKPLGMTRLVEVVCTARDPRMAADFCNTLAKEFIEQDLEVRWASAETTSTWLTRQVADLRVKLENSENRLQHYARDSNLLLSPEKESVAQEKLRQLQSELSRATADRFTKQASYELVNSASADTLPPVLDSGPLKEYQMKLTDLRRTEAELVSAFTADYPKVKKVQAQIRELESSLGQEKANVVARMKNEYAAAAQREALLSSAFASQERYVNQLVPKAAQYQMLQREVESGRQLYETMLQRVKEAGFVSAMKSSPMRVVDNAEPSRVPVAPRRGSSAAAGVLAGTLIGFAIAFLGDRSDRRLRMPGDAVLFLHTRELGVIPSARVEPLRRNGQKLLLSEGPASSDTSIWNRAVATRPRLQRLELTALQRPQSLLAECYRSAMSSLVFASGNGVAGRTLIFTSPVVGDGKTTVITNLGICLAQTQRRVLLIDGDMRKPRLHDIFEVENNFGLRNLLREEEKADTCAVSRLAQETFVPNLWLLPSGSGEHTENTASLLHSPHLKTLLDRVAGEFDLVLIDTPPMLHISDARVLGRIAGGVVLVVRAGVTTAEVAVAAQSTLQADGTPLAGVILNDFDPGRESQYGYYRTYYEYRDQPPAAAAAV